MLGFLWSARACSCISKLMHSNFSCAVGSPDPTKKLGRSVSAIRPYKKVRFIEPQNVASGFMPDEAENSLSYCKTEAILKGLHY